MLHSWCLTKHINCQPCVGVRVWRWHHVWANERWALAEPDCHWLHMSQVYANIVQAHSQIQIWKLVSHLIHEAQLKTVTRPLYAAPSIVQINRNNISSSIFLTKQPITALQDHSSQFLLCAATAILYEVSILRCLFCSLSNSSRTVSVGVVWKFKLHEWVWIQFSKNWLYNQIMIN